MDANEKEEIFTICCLLQSAGRRLSVHGASELRHSLATVAAGAATEVDNTSLLSENEKERTRDQVSDSVGLSRGNYTRCHLTPRY